MAEMIFKRKAYDKLLQWKSKSNGESAVLLQGARRIGKSTLAEEFAKSEYKSYILIDFSVAPSEVLNLFDDISDLNYIFFRLQLVYHTTLYERESVIIFDEVQKAPMARQAIKHLVKDQRYDYIETGSLISVKQRSSGIVIPSEETKIDMFPMDYEEFRWALGDTTTIPLLRQAYTRKESLGDGIHRRMMRDFRLYMLIGGMPQAVEKYITSNNLAEVDLVKRGILDLYEEDLKKLDSNDSASALFDSIPGQLSRNVSRFAIAGAVEGERADRMDGVLKSMEDSMTVNIAYHSNDPNIGLALSKDTSKFKMYVGDTGLFITLAFKDKDYTENDIYNKLLNDKLNTNMGYVYENVVAQMLRASGRQLFYNTIPTNDGKKYYEVDFLIADGTKISVVEVKSSGYKAHTSMDVFFSKHSGRIQSQYLIYTKDLKIDNGITCIPVYMAMFL